MRTSKSSNIRMIKEMLIWIKMKEKKMKDKIEYSLRKREEVQKLDIIVKLVKGGPYSHRLQIYQRS